jgi:hypothetical protein
MGACLELYVTSLLAYKVTSLPPEDYRKSEEAGKSKTYLTFSGGSLESFFFINFAYISAVRVDRSGMTRSMQVRC